MWIPLLDKCVTVDVLKSCKYSQTTIYVTVKKRFATWFGCRFVCSIKNYTVFATFQYKLNQTKKLSYTTTRRRRVERINLLKATAEKKTSIAKELCCI